MKDLNSRLFKITSAIITGIVILFCTSCSTQKNTFPNRAYHTVTSKFNVNFNGKEALKSGEAELIKKYTDNYTATLPIYNYPSKTDIVSIYPFMDRVIEKSSKSIYKHSMMIRGTEYVKTMDEVYLMMAKAYFHKQDYVQAQRICNYIISTYKGPKWDCREEAMILGARAALQQKYYSRAQALLHDAQYALYEKKSKKLNVMFNAAMAEYHLSAPDGDIQSAIDYIHEAIANRPKRDFTTRLYFILGQLYESMELLPEARKNFKKVIQRTPDYAMEFNAQIRLAMNYDGTPASKAEILKILDKMLDERKNEEYQDQIYYCISRIAKIDEESEEEIKYLALSVSSYAGNDYQRTYSSISLADIYFEKEQYVTAQLYYDTALISLPSNYPKREQIITKSTVLKELVENLNIITLQDSLQRIAKLSNVEREAWVRKMINAHLEKERQEAQEEANRMIAMQSISSMSNYNTSTSSNGKWYFYNQSLVTAGKTDFFRNWGSRKLEDNWRISNKQQISFDDLAVMNDPSLAKEKDTVQYDEDGNLIKVRETDPKKADFYIQDLPLTKEALDSSDVMIVNAMYNAAIIYLDLLDDARRSSETFEQLIKRFPDHSLALPSLFMLYRNYSAIHDPKAEEIKNIILSQYPDTDYARLIRDPDYYKRLQEEDAKLEREYEKAYQAYEKKDWNTTVRLANKAIPSITNDELRSKYEYLRAVAISQTTGIDSAKSSLRDIITNYPGTPVADLARTFLLVIMQDDQENPEPGKSPLQLDENGNETSVTVTPNPFVYKPEEAHYVIFLVDAGKLPVLDVKNEIASFNSVFFSLQKFNISSFYINQKEQMVTVTQFSNKVAAMDYYHAIRQQDYFNAKIADSSIVIYAISATNYTTYYKKVAERPMYNDFFMTNYEGVGQ